MLNTQSFNQFGWTILSARGLMSPHTTIKKLEHELESATGHKVDLPTVIFAENRIILRHNATGNTFLVSPTAAIKGATFDLESPDIAPLVGESSRNVPLVKHSAQWRESHKNEIDDAIKSDTDWTFTTPYWGTAIKSNPSIFQEVMTKSSTHHSFPNDVFLPLSCGDNTDISLPMDLLTRRDPILFYTESDMLEDDLDDNGVMRCSAKLRIMESCWFLLIRQDIRVDGVLLRQIDSRICHIFGSDHIIREFSIKEASFEKLLKRGIDLTGAKLGLFVNDAEGRTGSEVLDANLDTIYEQKHKILLLSE